MQDEHSAVENRQKQDDTFFDFFGQFVDLQSLSS
jgi:hypothetical protein